MRASGSAIVSNIDLHNQRIERCLKSVHNCLLPWIVQFLIHEPLPGHKSRRTLSRSAATFNNVNDQILDLYLGAIFFQTASVHGHTLFVPANPTADFWRFTWMDEPLNSACEEYSRWIGSALLTGKVAPDMILGCTRQRQKGSGIFSMPIGQGFVYRRRSG